MAPFLTKYHIISHMKPVFDLHLKVLHRASGLFGVVETHALYDIMMHPSVRVIVEMRLI